VVVGGVLLAATRHTGGQSDAHSHRYCRPDRAHPALPNTNENRFQ
jgi:hypothetical protein